MSQWQGWILTAAGQALEAKADAGKCLIQFTKMQLGNGQGKDLENATALINPVADLSITSNKVINKTTCQVEASITSGQITTDLDISEMGLFAKDPDDGEILYCVNIDNSPDTLPASGGTAGYEQTIRLNIITKNSANVTVVIDPNSFVTSGNLTNQLTEFMQSVNNTIDKTVTELEANTVTVVNNTIEVQYSQVTKLDTVALKGVTIPIKETQDFRRPPLEVLKLHNDGGNSQTNTLCDFDNSDANDFAENKYIDFSGGTMHPMRSYGVTMSDPAVIGSGYISDSTLIDLTQYAAVKGVDIR